MIPLLGQRYVYQQVDMDHDALKEMAEKTGGMFFAAKNMDELEKIYDSIDRLEKTKVEVDAWAEYNDLYPWCVLPGLFLLGGLYSPFQYAIDEDPLMEHEIFSPNMFYLIWLVILLAGVTIYGIRKRTRMLSQFMSSVPGAGHGSGGGCSRTTLDQRGASHCQGFSLATLALTGPLVGFRWEKVEQKGVDIMIALDCSRSMLATDIKPTRLEQAKREIIDLLKMMQSDRAGLVAFSGSAILQCPLTLDHSAFSLFLKGPGARIICPWAARI